MLYRTLEGLLERRYVGKKLTTPSVVMEYLRDADSAPCRTELDMCREIRNLLSHNADAAGEPVVEPSAAVLDTLQNIVEYVKRPLLAVECGTPEGEILYTHPNDCALDVMRHMARMGFSHVPVRDKTGLLGVLSAAGVMRYVNRVGFEGLRDDLRVGDMLKCLAFSDDYGEKYAFFGRDATLTTVRAAFERKAARNSRVVAAFITESGDPHARLLAMLTPWDLLRHEQ